MITDSTASPSFVESTPDWSQPVMITTGWRTGITINREGGEQRVRPRDCPRLAISYSIAAIATKAFAIMRGEAMAQLGKPVVVPVWTEYGTSSAFGTHSVTLDAAITSLKYKVGSWVYVVQGANKCFRKITSVSTPTINLSSSGGDKYPSGFNWALFSAGARVYPCILGSRSDNGFRFQSVRTDRKNQLIEIEEL